MNVKISMVSYLNTLPFVYGFKHAQLLPDHTQITLDYPAECARKLTTGEADLGLIPVAAISEVPNAQVVSHYCIGAHSDVKTVLLVSDCPKEELETVWLDYQSRTSVKLVQVLAKEFWNISPKWVAATPGFETQVGGKTGAVIIGDRAFATSRFRYRYDLAGEWERWTHLPFVFAAWVCNKPLNDEFMDVFNQTLRFGLEHTREAVEAYQQQNPQNELDLETYLTRDISFQLDTNKRIAMELFLSKIK